MDPVDSVFPEKPDRDEIVFYKSGQPDRDDEIRRSVLRCATEYAGWEDFSMAECLPVASGKGVYVYAVKITHSEKTELARWFVVNRGVRDRIAEVVGELTSQDWASWDRIREAVCRTLR